MTQPGPATGPAARPAFAHASEAELARILDFYAVRWAYEPDTFPIGWNLDGEVVESFSPDFYLPDLDLYVELTTLKQKLVRKKNRKLRRLRELYPDVRIKLFYARDFRMLLLKFGRLALIDELTGTTGQATPPRAEAGGLEEAPELADALPPPLVATAETVVSDVVVLEPAVPADSPGASETPAPATALAERRGRRRGRRRRRPADAAPSSNTPAAPGTGPRPV